MKLQKLILENFRGYKEASEVIFDKDLTAITGRNDSGKSTILEALEIFFNNKTVKIDSGDRNVKSSATEVKITCVFNDIPEEIVIDENYPTSFSSEYLLNKDEKIEITKTFKIQKTVSAAITSLRCVHPTSEHMENLHQMKLADLKKLGTELQVQDSVEDKRVASLWRHAIWNSSEDLALNEIELDVSTLEKESKAVYKKIEAELPTFALFKADRESVDADPEAKNPMQVAVDQAKKNLQTEIEELQARVESAVMEVAERTLDKVREMDPGLASELNPRFKEKPKWSFNFTLDGDEGVPINKRGSGVRRLILLNFFRAEAEKKKAENASPQVIYAIEEPETSQHPNYQAMLVEALLTLSLRPDCQVILTTHVPALAGLLPTESIRFIEKNEENIPVIEFGSDNVLEKVTESLGILPESDIASAKAVLLVEGHSDVTFVNHSANTLKNAGIITHSLKDLGIYAIPIGGCGNLKHWVTKKLIDQLGLNWGILMDSDIGDPIQNTRNIEKIQELKNQGKVALLTRKREPENYLDPQIFKESHDIDLAYTETCDAKKIIASALKVRKEDVLERFWPRMTSEQIISFSNYELDGVEKSEILEILNEVSALSEC